MTRDEFKQLKLHDLIECNGKLYSYLGEENYLISAVSDNGIDTFSKINFINTFNISNKVKRKDGYYMVGQSVIVKAFFDYSKMTICITNGEITKYCELGRWMCSFNNNNSIINRINQIEDSIKKNEPNIMVAS